MTNCGTRPILTLIATKKLLVADLTDFIYAYYILVPVSEYSVTRSLMLWPFGDQSDQANIYSNLLNLIENTFQTPKRAHLSSSLILCACF